MKTGRIKTAKDEKPRDPGEEALASRKRRDAALVLPLVGVALLSPPVLGLFAPDVGESGPYVALYLIGLWIVLIACAALLARRLGDDRA